MIEVAPVETEVLLDWYNAIIYCQFLEVDGKKDWRLPTLNELFDLSKADNTNSEINLHHNKIYWSNNEVDHEIEVAWCMGFGALGKHRTRKQKQDNRGCIRAVRDI